MVQKIINFVVYTNLWISFAALSSGGMIYLLFEKETNIYILAILFGGTLSRYNYIVFSVKEGSISEKFSFMFQKRKSAIIFFFIGLLISGYCLFYLTIKELLFLFHLIIISSLYFTSIKIRSFKIEKLRNLPYTKVFVIAYVWVGVTFFFPIIEELNFEKSILTISIERFFFFLGITFPFDIRDVEFDKKANVKTLTTKYGKNITNYIAIVCLLISAILGLYNYKVNLNYLLSVSYIIFIPLVLASRTKSNELHFTGLLDGTMILQFVIVFIFFAY